jgi:S1-C subfamily serine protease
MKKMISIVLGLSILTGCSLIAPPVRSEQVWKFPNTIVFFGFRDGQRFFSNGTAFFISYNGCLLTTDHEAQSIAGKQAAVSWGSRSSILNLKKIASFPDRDLALFKVTNSTTVFFLKIVEADYFPKFEKIFAISRKRQIKATVPTLYPPDKISIRQSDGSIKRVFGYTALNEYRPGESGSPVLNTDGEVIGIVIGGTNSNSLSGGVIAPISESFMEQFVLNYKSLCKSAP